jgi:hypothetical protein
MNNSKEVETLYYFLDRSVLIGDLNKAKTYLEILRYEYEKNKESFEVLKEDNRLDHLVKLGQIVDNGLVIKNYDLESIKHIKEIQEDEQQVEKEKELSKLILKNQL